MVRIIQITVNYGTVTVLQYEIWKITYSIGPKTVLIDYYKSYHTTCTVSLNTNSLHFKYVRNEFFIRWLLLSHAAYIIYCILYAAYRSYMLNSLFEKYQEYHTSQTFTFTWFHFYLKLTISPWRLEHDEENVNKLKDFGW